MTVQVLELLGPRLVGLHAREERAKGVVAVRFTVVLWEVPLTVAVTVAVPLLLMVPAGAALLKVIVQALEALGAKVVGLQAIAETSTGVTRLTVAFAELAL